MKNTLQVAAIALLAGSVFVGASGPAHAKKQWCMYKAWDNAGHEVDAAAYRKKKGQACKVAKRRCERRLKRKLRKGKFGRTRGCMEVTEA